jgi:hypothetical protein
MEDVIDSAMASATARFASGVNPKHLSKIWRISHEDAERTIDNTTHLLQRTTNPELSRNYGTNDRKLRCKRIRDYFYMDTFFATKKGGKASRGHTCYQLFVTKSLGLLKVASATSTCLITSEPAWLTKVSGATG